ncbi:uncharacterized protein LOC6578189 isoform X2 [Drosophila mojavensis]|uniref:Methuselah N-terminal domain-containing protein n=1 Tax=Drosophila mojavensis TaxID=7230 RepID=B4KJG8_DROMO|nr:uncharacterized protein LOC6578189 isoform X2 [Drosophila mojavensis]EDW13548.2 uncharacterized protein Dmoj_GI18268 [Drosophila mojavensis]
MCVKLAFLYLVFCYVFRNINSVKICCNPQSILYKIYGPNNLTTYNCTDTLESLNETDSAYTIDLLGTTETPQGYGLVEINDTFGLTNFPQCAHIGYSNVSLLTEISFTVFANSCILILDSKSLVSLTCQAKKDDMLQSIGIINKCCPHGYSFGADIKKCYLRYPDYNKYSAIFDNPMIFVDNSFKCPKNKVLVEYVLTAEAIVIQNERILLKEHKKSFQRSEFCIEVLTKNENSQFDKNIQQFIVRTCQQLKICDSVPCVRKCCVDGEIYAKRNLTTACTRDENNFQYHSIYSMNTSGAFAKPSVFGVLTGLECPKFRLDPESFSDEFHVISSTTGSLLITSTNKIYSNSQYCIESIRNSSFADQKHSCIHSCVSTPKL